MEYAGQPKQKKSGSNPFILVAGVLALVVFGGASLFKSVPANHPVVANTQSAVEASATAVPSSLPSLEPSVLPTIVITPSPTPRQTVRPITETPAPSLQGGGPT